MYFAEFYDADGNHTGTRTITALHRDDARRAGQALLLNARATGAQQAIVFYNHKSETLQAWVLDAQTGSTFGNDYEIVEEIEAGPKA
jgi:hypothetical protein